MGVIMVYKSTCNWGGPSCSETWILFPTSKRIVTSMTEYDQYRHGIFFHQLNMFTLQIVTQSCSVTCHGRVIFNPKRYPDVSVLGELRLTAWENLRPVYKLHRTHAVPGRGRRNAVRLWWQIVYSPQTFTGENCFCNSSPGAKSDRRLAI